MKTSIRIGLIVIAFLLYVVIVGLIKQANGTGGIGQIILGAAFIAAAGAIWKHGKSNNNENNKLDKTL